MDLLSIIAMVLLIWVAYLAGRASIIADLSRLIDAAELADPQEELQQVLTIERGEQGFFAYSAEGEFVAHHPTDIQILLDRVAERFPRSTWRIEQQNIADLGMTATELQEAYQQHLNKAQQ
jgi:hypothetical protein